MQLLTQGCLDLKLDNILLRPEGDLLNNISAALNTEPSRNQSRGRGISSSEQGFPKALSQSLSPTYSQQVEVPVTFVLADLGCGGLIPGITETSRLMLTLLQHTGVAQSRATMFSPRTYEHPKSSLGIHGIHQLTYGHWAVW